MKTLDATRYRSEIGLASGAAGLCLATVARAGDKLGLGSSPDFGWKQWLLLGAGIVLLVAAATLLAPLARRVAREPPLAAAPIAASTTGWTRWAAGGMVAVAGVVLVWTRLRGIEQSLWHDEAFSVLYFARGGPRAILGSSDYVPNDHILFNLLSWATVKLLPDNEATRRIWGVLPAIAAVALTVWWARRRLGMGVAVAVAVLATAAPMHLDLAAQARGYGLSFLAGAAMLVSADRLANGGGRGALAGFATSAFAGIATLPVFVFAAVSQAAPLLFRPRLRARVLLVLLGVGVAALALYWSVLEDVLGNAGQQFGSRLPWYAPITGPVDDLVGPLFALVVDSPYEPTAAWRVPGFVVLLLGIAELVRRREAWLALLIVVPLAGTYLILVVGKFYVAPRFSSFVLFYALVLAAVGVAGIGAWLARFRLLRPVIGAAAVAVIALALARTVDVAERNAELPREAFADAARIARDTQIARVVSDTQRPEGFRYAFGDRGFTVPPPSQLVALLCNDPGPLVFIHHPFPATPVPGQADTRCLVPRRAAHVRLLQRERGGFIDVWILPGR